MAPKQPSAARRKCLCFGPGAENQMLGCIMILPGTRRNRRYKDTTPFLQHGPAPDGRFARHLLSNNARAPGGSQALPRRAVSIISAEQ